ncbi:MAG: tripartite tricarboxylate transporter substrate binding protein [Oscillospiraceae bacterium]|nr:tripartite tricarboxylate transporter substrate binding protein [Oscillospiraceae bacterium]
MKKQVVWLLALALMLSVLVGCGAQSAEKQADPYPSKEITLVIPYDAGGANDRCARLIASINEQQNLTGVSVIVSNISGAGTKNGISSVVKSDPNGYTLLVHHNAMVTAAALGQLEDELQWQNGLRPIAQILETPLTFAVLAESRWATMQDLVNEILEKPGEVKFGFPGINSPQAFAFQNIISAFAAQGMNLDVHYVYYEGGSAVKTALLNGEIDVMPGITMDTVPSTKDGLYRILSVVTNNRLEALPDVPTFAECGYEMPSTTDGALRMVVWAPKNTPDDVVAYLENFLQTIYNTEEWQAFIAENSAIAVYRTADEVKEVFTADAETYNAIAADLQKSAG